MKGRYRIFPSLRNVHELANALDAREVLSLRNMARGSHGDPEDTVYLRFFEVLRSEAHFDKQRIKQKLAGSFNMSRLSDARCYLYHKMLAAIQDANNDTSSDVSDLTSQIKVLLYKGLHHHVADLFEKAVSFSNEIEDFEGVLRIVRFWKACLRNMRSARELGIALEGISLQEEETWAKLANLREMEQLFDRYFIAKSKEEGERETLLQAIASHPLFSGSIPSLSTKAEVLRLTLCQKMLGAESLANRDRIPILRQVVELIETKPVLFADAIIVERYLDTLHNLGHLGIIFNDDASIDFAIAHLEDFVKHRAEADAMVFEKVEGIKLLRLLTALRLDEIKLLAEKVREGLTHYGSRMRPMHRNDLVLILSRYYIYTDQFTEVVRLLHPDLESPPSADDSRQCLMRWIYFLIAHFELGNAEVMKSFASHALKYAQEYQLDNDGGFLILTFLKNLSHKNVDAKKSSVLRHFISNTIPILQSPSNLYYLVRFPIDLWAECQLSRKSFSKAVKNT